MFQDHSLPNGLRVLLVPITGFQSISVGIFVNVGSRYERESEAGISHFIEHMVFKGTSHRPNAGLIAEAIEGIGGVSNAYTGQETTAYYAKVASAHAGTAINVLADLVRYPLFEARELEKERDVIGEEINMMYDTPDSWVNVLVDQVLWPNHPLGQNVAGTHQSLANIGRDTLGSFFQDSYHPRNALVAMGGAFNPEEILAEVGAALGDWQPASRPVYALAPGPPAKARWHIEHRAIEQAHLCLALPALPRTHPDRYALSVLNTVLGEGMSCRLFLNIRENLGLAYAIDSGLNLLQDTGSLVIYAGVDPDRAPEALEAILTELARLRDEPVPPAELNKAREFLKGRLVLGLEDSFSRASWVAYQALFLEQIKTPEEVMQAYDAVTAEDVQAVAQKIINPANYCLAAVGPFGRDKTLGRLLGDKA